MSMREPLTPEERALAARLARLGPHGEPSPGLDARILAAARAATDADAGARPAAAPRRRPAHWPWAFGIAASVALAVGIAWQLRPLPGPVIHDEAASAQAVVAPEAMERRATGDASLQAGATQATDAAVAGAESAAPPAMDAAAAREKPGVPQPARPLPRAAFARRPPPAPDEVRPAAVEPQAAHTEAAAGAAADMALPAPPPTAPPAPPAPQAKAAAPTAFPQAPVRDAAARRSAAEAQAASAPVVMDEPEGEDVPPATADSPVVREAWLYRIRELRDAGRLEEARDSLMEYVVRYPRHAIPDDLEPLLDE